VPEGLGGERKPGPRKEAAGLPKLGGDGGVVGGIDHDPDMRVVLRRRPHHRGSADVDHLHDLFEARSLGARRLLERVQVHDDEIDRIDSGALEILEVPWVRPDGEDPRVDRRMERFHPPVQHFREPGVFRHPAHPNPARLEQPCGPSGREDLDPRPLEGTAEGDDALLLERAHQGTAHALRGHGALSRYGVLPRSPYASFHALSHARTMSVTLRE
jgi:hypothetical protein